MKAVYAGEAFPQHMASSIYLIGPTSRSNEPSSWRSEALRLLEAKGYEGAVFVPESPEGGPLLPFEDQASWELAALNRSDCALVWLPRDMITMPGLTTNVEFGMLVKLGKMVFGAPPETPHVRYLQFICKSEFIPQAETLEATVENALKLVGEGAPRSGGECEVPLHVWRTAYFQQWYSALKLAGNRLDGAKLEWIFRVGQQKGFMLFWAMHVKIWVEAEGRHKANEVVISRPSISAVVVYQRGATLSETKLVLIREFRSTAATADGFIREVAGGSSFNPNTNPLDLAAKEVLQETGLTISPDRFCIHEARQLTGTVTTHRAHLFSVEITATEMEQLMQTADDRMGVASETERTYREVVTFNELLTYGRADVDWSMMGMISRVVLGLY